MPYPTLRTVRAALTFAALAGAMVLSVVAPAHGESLRFGGTGSATGTVAALVRAYQAVDPTFELRAVPNLGSSGGIKALQSGAIELAAISRPLKPAEASSGLVAFTYGRTPFVLATSEPGVRNLTLAEVADVYAGRKTHWTPAHVVRLVLRPPTDGDVELLASFSPDVRAAQALAQAREGMVMALSDQDAVDAIERLPGALGTSSLALLITEQRRVAPISIDGVEPTVDNLVRGRYPHAKAMQLVVRKDAPASVLRFLEFVRSDAGRRVLRDTGHAPPSADATATATR